MPLNLLPLLLMVLSLLAVSTCAGGGSAAKSDSRPAEANKPGAEPTQSAMASDAPPTDVCVTVMRKTRDCADVYVPGLMALRVRLDKPPGIAARFQAEGEKAMLPVAREQFNNDWADDAIASNCKALGEKAVEDQNRIVASDRECLKAADCAAFTQCDLAAKEKRWTAAP